MVVMYAEFSLAYRRRPIIVVGRPVGTIYTNRCVVICRPTVRKIVLLRCRVLDVDSLRICQGI
jgi:hypothetical protein